MQAPRHPPLALRHNSVRQPPIPILDGMLNTAVRHHQQGELPEAERIYRRILAIDARHAGALHMLGTLAHQVGRQDIAAQLIRSAISIDPAQASYYSNLGTVLQAMGRLDEAAAAYEQALDRNPRLAEARMNLGAVLQLKGHTGQAAACFRETLALQPNLPQAHMNLGNILNAQGKFAEALSSHDRALALKPDFPEAAFNRGNTLQALGRFDDAVAGYRRALDLRPGLPEAHANMGNALHALERVEDAVLCYERAIALKPDYAEAHYNLGNARQTQQQFAEAAACYRRALAIKPGLAEAHYNLGNSLQSQDDLDAASACFRQAIAVRGNYAEARYNLGCILQQQGRLAEAMDEMRAALTARPDYPQARFGLALAQIQSGNFAVGWHAYESRWQSPDHDTPPRSYPLPLWAGEKLPAGRLFLWGEQGVGDEIMFAGMVPDAILTGNAIALECDPRLQPLFARSFPEIEVVGASQPPAGPAERQEPLGEAVYAAHLPTGSLPSLFRGNKAAFARAASPYLTACPAARDGFRAAYADGRRLIGLAWHTGNRRTGRKRSMSLAELAPLFALNGIRWISLQYGDFDGLEQQAAIADVPILIDRSVDQFADLDLFAAQVAAMDHVVTIDNSTAHLAGALGLPVSLMLPFAADWRWLTADANDACAATPWYPTLRLFRQPAPGDWASVVRAIATSLSNPPAAPPG
jgi:tetratricopeptide (TPR) repeat protein